MKELIIHFSPQATNAYVMTRRGKSLAVVEVLRVGEELAFRQLLQRHRLKKGRAVIEDLSTVVKGIQIPDLHEDEVESFVKNNINEYFVLDPQEYLVDYRVTTRSRKTKDMHLLLSAEKKTKIQEIRSFFEHYRIGIEQITVMPDILQRALCCFPAKSVALLRVIGNTARIHIQRDQNLFLHTAFEFEMKDGVISESTLENISYYLSFYSRQYFGEVIEALVLQVEKRYELPLKEALQRIHENPVIVLPPVETRGPGTLLLPEETWLHGMKRDAEKELNFGLSRGDQLKNRRQGTLRRVALSYTLFTLVLVLLFGLWRGYLGSLYSVTAPGAPGEKLSQVEAELSELKKEESLLLDQAEILTKIQGESLPVVEDLEALKKALPQGVFLESASFTPEGIQAQFQLSPTGTRTLDALRLIAAINETQQFLPIGVDTLYLNEQQESLQLLLQKAGAAPEGLSPETPN